MPWVPKGDLTGKPPRALADDDEAAAFWIKAQEQSSQPDSTPQSQYTLLDANGGAQQELTHPQIQQVKGLDNLKDGPKLSLAPTFEASQFRTLYAWIEALVELILKSHPSKGPLFLTFFDYAVQIHQMMLDLPLPSRDRVLLSFKSKVRTMDVVNQSIARRWAHLMITGLPSHVKAKLWMQKSTWSRRLLGSAGAQSTLASSNLNLQELRSPLGTPDGIILGALLSI